MVGRTHPQTDGWAEGQADGQAGSLLGWQAGRQTDWQMADRQMADRQTDDRQTECTQTDKRTDAQTGGCAQIHTTRPAVPSACDMESQPQRRSRRRY
eukprot:gene18287-biopygen12952